MPIVKIQCGTTTGSQLATRVNQTIDLAEANTEDINTLSARPTSTPEDFAKVFDNADNIDELFDTTTGESAGDIVASLRKTSSFIEEVAPPTGFSVPALFSSVLAQKVGSTFSCSLSSTDFIDFNNDFSRYMYVDIRRPNSQGDGLSWATAKKSIGSAVDSAIADAIDTIILVRGGVYPRFSSTMSVGADKVLTCNIAIMAVAGRVVQGPFEELTWTVNTTYPQVYQVNRSAGQQVLNPLVQSKDGSHYRYRHVSSVLLCSQNPGSWHTDGSIIYVHTPSSGVVSDANARVFLSARNLTVSGNFKLYMYGIDSEGGNAGALKYSRALVVSDKCSFRYAISGAQSSGLRPVDGVVDSGGHFVGIECDASFNSKDGFNFRRSGSAGGNSLTINCTGMNNGQIVAGVESSNGITNHEGGKTIDIGGIYLGSAGANAAFVNTNTQAWCYGTVAGNSGGDYNTISTGGFSIGTDGAMWLEHTVDEGTKVGLNSGEIINIRKHRGSGERFGTITEFTR